MIHLQLESPVVQRLWVEHYMPAGRQRRGVHRRPEPHRFNPRIGV